MRPKPICNPEVNIPEKKIIHYCLPATKENVIRFLIEQSIRIQELFNWCVWVVENFVAGKPR